jgi:hypothetical protein
MDPAGFLHQQDQPQIHQGRRSQAGGAFAVEQGRGDVELLIPEPGFELGPMSFAQRQLEPGMLVPDVDQHLGEMVAQQDARPAHPQLLTVAPDLLAHGLDAIEERFDEGIELFAGGFRAKGRRRNKVTPSASSSWRIWALTAGCWMP